MSALGPRRDPLWTPSEPPLDPLRTPSGPPLHPPIGKRLPWGRGERSGRSRGSLDAGRLYLYYDSLAAGPEAQAASAGREHLTTHTCPSQGDAREPENSTKTEESRRHLQGVLYSTRGAQTSKTLVTNVVNTQDSQEQAPCATNWFLGLIQVRHEALLSRGGLEVV
eukprot:1195327-Prorocentrum_minimum.AAC.7